MPESSTMGKCCNACNSCLRNVSSNQVSNTVAKRSELPGVDSVSFSGAVSMSQALPPRDGLACQVAAPGVKGWTCCPQHSGPHL